MVNDMKISPETHHVGDRVFIQTIDNMEITGEIEAFTSDAVIIKTNRTTVVLHPHEIHVCMVV